MLWGGICQGAEGKVLVGFDVMNRLSAFSSVRACVAWFVTLLQVVSALHVALVPHGYSSTLGGVVHVHAAARAATAVPAPLERGPAVHATSATCSAERCLVADAPQSSPPRFALLAAGSAAFGDARLLSEREARTPESLRSFLSAPKTSPPYPS